MTEQPKQPKLNYGRFVLVMLVVTWAVRQLVGETWLAVAVALAVNVLISWPRRPKGGGETGEARPEGEVRAWSDPKPELEPKPGREIRSLADLEAADTTFAAGPARRGVGVARRGAASVRPGSGTGTTAPPARPCSTAAAAATAAKAAAPAARSGPSPRSASAPRSTAPARSRATGPASA
jgi:hypothetical protein